jgi:D-3-phosphoglycerate dehydrogenase
MTKALITCQHLQRNFEAFRPQYDALAVTPVLPAIPGQQLDARAMRLHLVGCDAVIAGDDEIDASVLEACRDSGLKAVIKWGIGTDNIDKAAAKALGIPVFNTPGVFSDEVADLAMSLLLMLMRGTHLMHQSVIGGGWRKVEGRSLAGMTAGIIGLGSIGLGIARRTAAFGMATIGSDVAAIAPDILRSNGAAQVSLDEVLERSDVILLACNLTAENRHLINAGAFERMKRGAYIVNVSRGPLIDETALAAALTDGRIAGAGLDVFEIEPLPPTSPLRTFDTCVFTTHNGSNTREAVARINQKTTDILFHVLGLKPLTSFNPNRVA